MATEEIEISELEYTEELASDNLFPVESASDTKATSLQVLKNWLSSFFVGKNGDETIKGTKTLDKNPILNSSTANMVAIIDGKKKLVSDSNISTTELGYLNGVTSNLQTQVNGRAKTDLSNVASVASSFKEASVGWGMPDYSAGVGKASNRQFTAERDGFLLYNYAGATSTNTLTINNININLTTQAQYSHGIALMLPIPKGTTYKLTGGGNKLIFYPLKGVN